MEYLIVIVALIGIISALVGLFFLGWSQNQSATLLIFSLLLVLLRALWDLPLRLIWIWLLATISLVAGFYVRTRRT